MKTLPAVTPIFLDLLVCDLQTFAGQMQNSAEESEAHADCPRYLPNEVNLASVLSGRNAQLFSLILMLAKG